MKRREWIYLAILFAVIAFSAWHWLTRTYTHSRTAILLDTFVEVRATGPEPSICATVDSALAYIGALEDSLSYFAEGSSLWRLNASEGDSLALDADIEAMLILADKLWRQTGGSYDVTIGALSDLWDFGSHAVPDSAAIDSALAHVGWSKLTLGDGWVCRPPGMRINLGSVCKGYIIDKAVTFMLAHGATSGYINAGGDIRYFGGDRNHSVGIQHPRGRQGEDVIAVLSLPPVAVVTSGDYERAFELDGVRYHHILDPRTGWPVEGVISVTVIAPTATLADALATALFLVSPDEGIELVRGYEDVEAIIYYRDGEDVVSLKSMGMKRFLVRENE
ncbi:MAG: FAD:protein FMN transferase [Candidatus Cloacimonetes bacterium]|nr:FAD:protein FMN transferase [Candidatus Cloacimonadota bacterium]